MKRVAFFIVLAFALLSCKSFSSRSTTEQAEALTTHLFQKSLEYSGYECNSTNNPTDVKSDNGDNYSESDIPSWMKDYLDMYLDVATMNELNEMAIIELLSEDSSISMTEKKMVVDALAVGYYGKGLSEIIECRTTKAVDCATKCRNSYNRKVLRALALAVLTVGASVYLAQPEGVILAVAGYAGAMGQAEDDYYECLDNC